MRNVFNRNLLLNHEVKINNSIGLLRETNLAIVAVLNVERFSNSKRIDFSRQLATLSIIMF